MELKDPRLLDPTVVQFFLDNRKPMEQFTVIFKKVDGSQRVMTGTLDPTKPYKRDKAVPIMTEEGWRSFRLDSVLSINAEGFAIDQ